jgi:hypothetical protein
MSLGIRGGDPTLCRFSLFSRVRASDNERSVLFQTIFHRPLFLVHFERSALCSSSRSCGFSLKLT